MADDLARAFWVTGPGRGEIRAEKLEAVEPGQVLVRTVYTGVSRGTECLVFNARVPVTEHARMRAPFQSGDFPYPLKYGYINVGTVEKGPAELVGRTVFSLYPHQTRFVVDASAVEPLPAGLPPGRAVLAANMQTAVNGLWDGGAQMGDRIAVIGAGTVGCLAAWLAAHIAGTDVQLIDTDPAKAVIANALGLPFCAPAEAADDADLVFHCSGNPAGLETALALAGADATVVELSWYGERRVELPLGEAFHSRRLTIRSSQIGAVAAPRRSRFSAARRNRLALELLTDDTLDSLISGESRFEDLPALLPELCREPGALCHRIAYG